MNIIDSLLNKFNSKNKNAVETTSILQMEATECGAASLAMIMAYYGLWVPLEKVREACGVNRDGANAQNIIKAAKAFGFTAVGKFCTLKKLKKQQFPLILHWEFNHFVVLEGFDDEVAYLNDPAMGHRRIPLADFKSSFTGVCIDIKPAEGFQKGGKKYDVVKVLKDKLLQDRAAFYFILCLSLCMLVPRLATPVTTSIFMDDVLSGKHADWMKKLLWTIFGIGVGMGILTWLRLYILTKWQTKLTIAGSGGFFWHVLHMPISFFQQRSPSEVAGRVAMNQSVANILTGNAATAVFDIFLACFYIIVLCFYNLKLTIVAVLCSAANFVLFFYIRDRLLEISMSAQMDAGKEYGTAINGLMNIETLKANGGEDDFFGTWAGYHTKAIMAEQKIGIYNMYLQLLPVATAAISSTMVMTIGGYSIMDGAMTAGIFMAFQTLQGNLNEPVTNLLNLSSSIQNTEMELKRLDDATKYPVDSLNFPENPPEYGDHKRLTGEVELKNVVFGYSKTQAPLFEDFNMHLKPGDWVALVGGSGSGKSTIAKLVNGIYEEWEGQLLFDGIPRRSINHDVICNSMSVVDQDIYLFEGTVTDNITLFDSSIRQSDVVRAAQDACIIDDINRLDKGFNQQVLEGGSNFSGGQRQRIEIARALATNPSILIMDEATSALDPVTELKVIENIRHRGCTCIVVAHRLSTIRDCDEIIVIDHGRVVERGRHKELMALDGAYAKLVGGKEDKEKGGVQQ